MPRSRGCACSSSTHGRDSWHFACTPPTRIMHAPDTRWPDDGKSPRLFIMRRRDPDAGRAKRIPARREHVRPIISAGGGRLPRTYATNKRLAIGQPSRNLRFRPLMSIQGSARAHPPTRAKRRVRGSRAADRVRGSLPPPACATRSQVRPVHARCHESGPMMKSPRGFSSCKKMGCAHRHSPSKRISKPVTGTSGYRPPTSWRRPATCACSR
jgi:hypothetical protein